MINLEDLKKLEIRIGRIISAEKVDGADKLLRLLVDLGGEERQIVSGIALSYPDPNVLVGRQVPILANLEPRTIRGLESRGMLLAVSHGEGVALLHPDQDVLPGSEVR